MLIANPQRLKPKADQRVILFVQVYLLISLIAFGLLYSSDPIQFQPDSLLYPLCVFFLGLVIWFFSSWYFVTARIFDPYPLFLTSAVLFNGKQIILEVFHLNQNGFLDNEFSNDGAIAIVYFVILGLSSLHLGAMLSAFFAVQTTPKQPPPRSLPLKRVYTVGRNLLCLSILPAVLVLKDAIIGVLAGGYTALYQQEMVTGLGASAGITSFSDTCSRDRQRCSSNIDKVKLKHTRRLFIALCFYLLSQGFTIPILAVGHWAVWLSFTDVAIGLLVITFLLSFRYTTTASIANQDIFRVLVFFFLGCVVSYLFYVDDVNKGAMGTLSGLYQIYRLFQFICVFWIVAQIPLPRERINVLNHVVEIVLIFACISVLLTYTAIIPLATWTAHLPPSEGPWRFYESMGRFGGVGYGAISYNHAYTASQILMLVGLKFHLGLEQRKLTRENVLLLASIAACFLSESRAGLAAILLFAVVYWFQEPIYALLVSMMVGAAAVIAPLLRLTEIDLVSAEGSILERQKTLLAANDTDNLSGRDEIWMAHFATLEEKPVRWIVGRGFGSSLDLGDNAHMLLLQIVSEVGLIGLLVFGFLFWKILRNLYQSELKGKPVFWVTIALLFSSFTQETLYPVISQGHFMGFYLCSVAIVLRTKTFSNSISS